MKKDYLFSLLFTLSLFCRSYSAVCTASVNGGNWSNAGTWSCGHSPACGDSIVIPSGILVQVTSMPDYSGCTNFRLSVYGTLNFAPGKKLNCPCDSRLYVFAGGAITGDGGGGNANYIDVCGSPVWTSDDGPFLGPNCLPASNPYCGKVLPIELMGFSGNIKDQMVELAWATASEKNNDFFEVERSADANSFESVVRIQSKSINGYSQKQLDYFAMDESPLANISYYRLKQTDRNKQSSYSPIISVNVIKAKNVKFMIYPNPNNGEFTADISGIENNHEVKIVLKDQNGNLVYDSSFYIQDLNSKIKIIPQNKLANGVYICTLILEDIEYSVKVVVS
jgi:hypothetical protein